MQDNSNKTRRVLQWKYTSSKYNIEQSTGFFTFSKSKNLTDDEKNELVDKVAHYDALESLPKRPTQEELKNFPVAFSCFRLASGKAVLCRTQYIGQDYASSRYGNFFAHALILQEGDWNNPLCYFNSPTFSHELTQEEIELGRVPEPLEELALESVDKTKPLADITTINPAWFNIIKRLVDRFYDALKNKTNLVVYLDEENLRKYAAPILSMFLDVLPEDFRRRVGFCTYVRDATYEPLINTRDNYCFIAFAPSTSKEMHSAGKYISVDLSNLSTLVKQEYKTKSVYACRLTCDFLEHVVSVYPNDASSSSSRSLHEVRENDLIYMDNVGYIDELLHGQLSNFEAVKGVWEYLWRLFLKEDYFVIVQTFVSTVLQNNYSKIPFSRKLVREILAFSVRVIDGRLADVEYSVEERRNACVFWRNHIPQEEKAKTEWRACVLTEVKSVFGDESFAASVCVENDISHSLKNVSERAYLQTFLSLPSKDPVDDFLTIALGFRVIIEDELLSQIEVGQLNRLYGRLSKTEPWKSRIEIDFFETFATEINNPETYRSIIKVIGNESLKRYIERKFDDCPMYWRIGKGVPIVGKTKLPISDIISPVSSSDNGMEDNEQDEQLVFVDAQTIMQDSRGVRTLAQKTKESRQDVSLLAESVNQRDGKVQTRFPGADALILWLVEYGEKNDLELLEEGNLFGAFLPESKRDYRSYKDFTQARDYFKDNYKKYYEEKKWESLEIDWYYRVIKYRNKVLMRISIGLLLLIVLTVSVFLTIMYWDVISLHIQRLTSSVSQWFKRSPTP